MKINGLINVVIEWETTLSKAIEKATPLKLAIAIIPLIFMSTFELVFHV